MELDLLEEHQVFGYNRLNIFYKYGVESPITDLAILTRAKKGNQIMKKTKTKEYNIASAYVSEGRTINIMKCDSEIIEIKNADIKVMDLASTGSLITKNKIDDMCAKYEEQSFNEEKEIKNEDNLPKEEKQMQFNDFINDFKI